VEAAWMRLLFAVVATVAPLILLSQETPAALDAEAARAYRARNFAQFVALEKRASALDPANPRYLYNIACGQALSGDATEAVRLLNRLFALKLDFGAATDTDFDGIRRTPEWAGFDQKLAELRHPMIRSGIAFTLTDPSLVATGIAVDEKTGTTYIASVRERKIVRRTKAGAVDDFITEAQDGFLAGASLLVDSRHRILYASTSAVPFMRGYRKEDQGQAGVFAFDLKSGKLMRKAMLTVDGKIHFLNALAMDREGTVFVSDSGTPGIYRLKPGAGTLETFVGSDVFRSTQGLAFSPDEKTLYVADFSDGLWAVDLASKRRRRMESPTDVWLGGMDGLTPVPGGFITVQIGVRPERVLRLRLSSNHEKIAAAEILEMNHPNYSGPIQGVISGNNFLYIANSQLARGNGETGAFSEDHAYPTIVLSLPIR
jgi:sugar lactone lactonase YvrE